MKLLVELKSVWTREKLFKKGADQWNWEMFVSSWMNLLIGKLKTENSTRDQPHFKYLVRFFSPHSNCEQQASSVEPFWSTSLFSVRSPQIHRIYVYCASKMSVDQFLLFPFLIQSNPVIKFNLMSYKPQLIELFAFLSDRLFSWTQPCWILQKAQINISS